MIHAPQTLNSDARSAIDCFPAILQNKKTVESWNKIQKQLKDMLLRDLSQIKLKQLSVIFFLNHINNLLIMQKLYIWLYHFINNRNYFNY